MWYNIILQNFQCSFIVLHDHVTVTDIISSLYIMSYHTSLPKSKIKIKNKRERK